MEQILQGIEGVDAFLFMVSPRSIISEVCKVEINHAAKNNKRIIPVVLELVQPADTIDVIRQLNWIFLREADDDFTGGLQRIKTAIELDFEWVAEHSRLQNRALDWERRKETSLLLRGRDLWTVRQKLKGADSKDPKPTDLQRTYVLHSSRNERRTFFIYTVVSLVTIIMALLAYTANVQRKLAEANAVIAEQNRVIAEQNQQLAEQKSLEAEANARKAEANARKAVVEKQTAEKAQQRAERSRQLADAQRSAALAQIYQIRPGELFTSTLLAINSWQIEPSEPAEEILRENISLLPVPVKQENHAGRINAITVNAEGDIIVSAGEDGMICAWQVADGTNLFCKNSAGPVTDALITPDNQSVIAGDELGNLSFINISDGTISTPIPPGAPITDLAIQEGRDSSFVAVTRTDNRISIINWKTRQKSGSDLIGSGVIKFAVFSPKGLQIATGTEGGVISVWNLTQANPAINTDKHNGEILSLKFSPDGRYLVSGGADGLAVILDAKTGAEVYRALHSDQVLDIAFSKDSKRFVTASKDRYIRVWDTDSGKQLLIMSQSDAVRAVKLTEDGRWIISTGDDKTVRVWDANTGTQFVQIPIKGKGTSLGLSKDGKYLISGDENGFVNVWDISLIPAPEHIVQFSGVTGNALYSLSGIWIAASDDRQVWLLTPKTITSPAARPPGNPLPQLRNNIERMTFSAKDKWLAVLTAGNDIVIYNVQNRNGRTISPANRVTGLAFSPDEKTLFTSDTDGNLQVWDLITSKLISMPVKYDQPITALIATPEQLLLGARNELHILDINTFQELEQPKSSYLIDRLAVNADATLLASINSNGQIQIWRKENGTFGSPKTTTKRNGVSLAFSPTGNLLAVGAADSLLLLDPTTLEEYARIPMTGTVNSISFSPDGANFITASLRVLQFWDLAKIQQVKREGLVETACQHLFENFSHSQWDILFNEKYKPLCANLPEPDS